MPRDKASRKYQLTINNPQENGYSHEIIKETLKTFSSLKYWCLCDEIGENGTYHTHIYVIFKNAVMFSTMQKKFYGAHLEFAQGTNKENYEYIRKDGKWKDDKKHETNIADTFEEFGELPPDRNSSNNISAEVYEMIKDGASDQDILETYPGYMTKIDYINKTRQTLLKEKYKDTWRDVEVTYIYGDTGTGKTRSVMDKYGYSNVYRVTDYAHPFDGYKGEDVILFEEFRSSLPLKDMLTLLDGYPVELPSRYTNKVACYTKVYFATNIPLDEQYKNVQREEPQSWDAFCRRINTVIRMKEDGKDEFELIHY